jgi:hypothetical protein
MQSATFQHVSRDESFFRTLKLTCPLLDGSYVINLHTEDDMRNFTAYLQQLADWAEIQCIIEGDTLTLTGDQEFVIEALVEFRTEISKTYDPKNYCNAWKHLDMWDFELEMMDGKERVCFVSTQDSKAWVKEHLTLLKRAEIVV